MLRRILVPLDGSVFAERALPLATFLARRSRGRLHLGYTLEPGTGYRYGAIRQALGYVERLGRQIVDHGIGCEITVVAGEPTAALLDLVEQTGDSLISLASLGLGRSSSGTPGLQVDRLVEQVPVPVLIQTPLALAQVGRNLDAGGPILVPLDGSALAEMALPEVARLAQALGRELRRVDVDAGLSDLANDWPRPMRPSELTPSETTALIELAAPIRRHRIAPPLGRCDAGDLVRLVRERIEQEDAFMVAVATGGRPGSSPRGLGPTAAAVVRAAHLPVLLLGPTALAHALLSLRPDSPSTCPGAALVG